MHRRTSLACFVALVALSLMPAYSASIPAELPSLYIKPPSVQGLGAGDAEYLALRFGKGLLVALTRWYSVRDTDIVTASMQELEKLVSSPSNSRDVVADINRILNSDYIVTVDIRKSGSGVFVAASLIDFASGAPVVRSSANVEECDPSNPEELAFYVAELARALHEPGYRPGPSPFKGGVKIRVELGKLEAAGIAPLPAASRNASSAWRPETLKPAEKVARLDAAPGPLPAVTVSRDAAQAAGQIARGLDLLLADGDRLLNGGDPAEAEAMYLEVLKRARSYAAYERELAPYRSGAERRIGAARKVGFLLRIAAADALGIEKSLDAYRAIRDEAAAVERAYAADLAPLGPIVAARVAAARASALKAQADRGDALYAAADYEGAAIAYKAAGAALRDRPEEFSGRRELEATVSQRLSAARAAALRRRMEAADALYSEGKYDEAASALREAVAYRAAVGAELEDSREPFAPALSSRLDAAARSSVALVLRRGDEALARGDWAAAQAAYAEADKAVSARAAELAEPAAQRSLVAGRQIAASRYEAAAPRASADGLFIAGEFSKAKAAYGAALAALRACPRYAVASASARPSSDEKALLEDASLAEAGVSRVSQTVADIFRNKVLSYRDRLLILDVRSVRDPAAKDELRRTALDAALFILRDPSSADVEARAQFAAALGMVMGDESLRGLSLDGPWAMMPFPVTLRLGGRPIELPAFSSFSVEGEGWAVAYDADFPLGGGLAAAARFPVAYSADGRPVQAILASRSAVASKKGPLRARPGSPALFHPNGAPSYLVVEGEKPAAVFLNPSGAELFRCPLDAERKLASDLELELRDGRHRFAKGTSLAVFGGGRYLSGLEGPGRRVFLRLYDYPGPAVSDEVFVEGGVFRMGLSLKDHLGFPLYDDESMAHDAYLGPFWMRREVEAGESVSSDARGESFVTYAAIAELANRRSAEDGLAPCYAISGLSVRCDYAASGWRLPTEAEWEYASLGGVSARDFVAQSGENELGLRFDAKQAELCGDLYGPFSEAPVFDPRGPVSGGEAGVLVARKLAEPGKDPARVQSGTLATYGRGGSGPGLALSYRSSSARYRLVRAAIPSTASPNATVPGPRRQAPIADMAATPGFAAVAQGFELRVPSLRKPGPAIGGIGLRVVEAGASGSWVMLKAELFGPGLSKSAPVVLEGAFNRLSGELSLEAVKRQTGFIYDDNVNGLRGRILGKDFFFVGNFLRLELGRLFKSDVFFAEDFVTLGGADLAEVELELVATGLPAYQFKGRGEKSCKLRFTSGEWSFELPLSWFNQESVSRSLFLPPGAYRLEAFVDGEVNSENRKVSLSGATSFEAAIGAVAKARVPLSEKR